jgi:hypothetical protein
MLDSVQVRHVLLHSFRYLLLYHRQELIYHIFMSLVNPQLAATEFRNWDETIKLSWANRGEWKSVFTCVILK